MEIDLKFAYGDYSCEGYNYLHFIIKNYGKVDA